MKPMTLYQRFRVGWKEMKLKGVGLDEEFVLISRRIWDENQRKYDQFLKMTQAVRPN